MSLARRNRSTHRSKRNPAKIMAGISEDSSYIESTEIVEDRLSGDRAGGVLQVNDGLVTNLQLKTCIDNLKIELKKELKDEMKVELDQLLAAIIQEINKLKSKKSDTSSRWPRFIRRFWCFCNDDTVQENPDADDVQSPVQVDTAPQPVLAPTVNRSISISEVIEFQPPPRSADGQSSAVPATDSASMASSPQLPFDSQAGTSFPAGPGGPDSDSGSSSASCAVVEPVLGSYISNPTPARSSRPTWRSLNMYTQRQIVRPFGPVPRPRLAGPQRSGVSEAPAGSGAAANSGGAAANSGGMAASGQVQASRGEEVLTGRA